MKYSWTTHEPVINAALMWSIGCSVVTTHEALMIPSWISHELGLRSFDLVDSGWITLSSCRFCRSRGPSRPISYLILALFFCPFWVFCGITHEALMSPSWTTHELGLCSFDLVISRWSLLSSCRFPLLVLSIAGFSPRPISYRIPMKFRFLRARSHLLMIF